MKSATKAIGLIIKVLVLVAIIGIGVLAYQTCSSTPLVQRIDKTLPDASAAPFEVATITHSYQANRATLNDNGSVTMIGWYEQIGGKWVYHEDLITLPPVLKPRISRR